MKRPAGESQLVSSAPAKKHKGMPKRGKGSPELYSKGQIYPDVFHTTMRYSSNLVPITSIASATTFHSLILNGMFDFDFNNTFGDKQPLYYDQLLTSTGPFKAYNCKKWKTVVEVYNQSSNPLSLYWTQSADSAEGDSLIEAQNRPNVRELILTAKGGSKDKGKITAPGSMVEIFGDIINPESAIGSFAGNPTVKAYGTLFFSNPGATSSTLIDCFVRIVHDFDVALSSVDGTVSA